MAWRATSSFLCCVLWPLCWAGLLTAHQAQGDKRSEAACFKTPLWPAWLTLDTDNMVEPTLMGHELSDMTFGGYSDGLMFERLKEAIAKVDYSK